ncbi:MAG: hypothetical protein M1541_17325 [Acidobacteria bacterium]|nr:hypothetical protein [Acidobacteriota bacterium]
MAKYRSCKGILCLAWFFAGPLCCAPPVQARVDSVPALLELFENPPAEYSTVPFFVWNGDVTEADIDRQIVEYRQQHIRAFFIHPRPGMITPYLSQRWFALYRYAVDRAKKLGMRVWIYDENSYPSGFAGGHVPAEMPESWNQGQGLTLRKVSQLTPEAARQCKVLLRRDGERFLDIPPQAGEAPLPPGDYYCFEVNYYDKSPWHGGFSWVDLLKPGVTDKFIEITMQRGYQRDLGGDFGRTIPGVFSDEPIIYPPAANGIRWTPDVFGQFRKRWGYDLETNLPSLFEQRGDWRRVRHNYYATLLDLYIERWSKPWSRYAEAHNLIWTGHYWEHGWPSPAYIVDNMAMYEWHHMPGIDLLFNQFDEGVNAQFGNARVVKELSSVANQMDRPRALCESYGGAGWELRFEDMKRLGDWEYALGVNFMNQHLSFQTLAGARKYDYPRSRSPAAGN